MACVPASLRPCVPARLGWTSQELGTHWDTLKMGTPWHVLVQVHHSGALWLWACLPSRVTTGRFGPDLAVLLDACQASAK